MMNRRQTVERLITIANSLDDRHAMEEANVLTRVAAEIAQGGERKVLYIMRGLPGSGKSTKAKDCAEGGAICSTDDYWYVGDHYLYDRERIGDAHKWNISRAARAMQAGISPLVIDNTNVQRYMAKPYVQLAQEHGYDVQVVEPSTPWAFDAEELTKRNRHNVPREVIDDMLANWENDFTVDNVLSSMAPWEKEEPPVASS